MSQTITDYYIPQNSERCSALVSRLMGFKSLQPGWWEGFGQSCSPSGLDWLADMFVNSYPELLQLPEVFPTEEGNISAEWETRTHFIAVEFMLLTQTAKLFVFNEQEDCSSSSIFDLSEYSGWHSLIEQLKDLFGYFVQKNTLNSQRAFGI